MTHHTPEGLSPLQRSTISYARLEQKAGYQGDLRRAQKIALHVYRTSRLYGFSGNPYAIFW